MHERFGLTINPTALPRHVTAGARRKRVARNWLGSVEAQGNVNFTGQIEANRGFLFDFGVGAMAEDAAVAQRMALRCVQVMLEETQRFVVDRVTRLGLDLVNDLLGSNISQSQAARFGAGTAPASWREPAAMI